MSKIHTNFYMRNMVPDFTGVPSMRVSGTMIVRKTQKVNWG